MNKKTIQELLNTAKEGATTEELKSLVSHLETFMGIEERREQGQIVKNEWIVAREKLWLAFEEVLQACGIPSHEFQVPQELL